MVPFIYQVSNPDVLNAELLKSGYGAPGPKSAPRDTKWNMFAKGFFSRIQPSEKPIEMPAKLPAEMFIKLPADIILETPLEILFEVVVSNRGTKLPC